MASLTAMREAIRQSALAPSIRGVIFDLDGTLLDSESLYQRAFQAALAAFGRAVDRAEYALLVGLATPDRAALLSRRFGPTFPCDAFKAEYYRQKQRCLADGIPLKPGALELLDWLRIHDIPAAVATAASSATAQLVLQRQGLHRQFCSVVCRDHVASCKPHPDLFLQAARQLHADPADCLVLEDSAPGIAAACAAGTVPILIPDVAEVSAPVRQKSFAVLPDLYAVRAILAGE